MANSTYQDTCSSRLLVHVGAPSIALSAPRLSFGKVIVRSRGEPLSKWTAWRTVTSGHLFTCATRSATPPLGRLLPRLKATEDRTSSTAIYAPIKQSRSVPTTYMPGEKVDLFVPG